MDSETQKNLILIFVLSICFGYILDGIYLNFLVEPNKRPKTSMELEEAYQQEKIDTVYEAVERKRVFVDIDKTGFLSETRTQRIVIELYDDMVPSTVQNFYELCKANAYAKTPFHRVINNFMIQSGDFVSHDGTGGKSIYGEDFADENFELKNRTAFVAMANSGPDTNSSQFFILLKDSAHLDGKHVVFGKVVQNMEFVYEIGAVETNVNDEPIDEVIIARTGILN